MYRTTLVKYDDQHTKIEQGVRLEAVFFGIGALNNNIVWVKRMDSNDKSTFPIVSEFFLNYCKSIYE